MERTYRKLKLVFCGASDVDAEKEAARRVAGEWNDCQSDAYGIVLHFQHWSTNTFPEMGDRPQGVINRQMADQGDLIVAAFRGRYGSPTGVCGSGTEEEIKRAIAQNKLVMVYFHEHQGDPGVKTGQEGQVAALRAELRSQGLYADFGSTSEFENAFRRHLAAAVQRQVSAAIYAQTAPAPQPSQTITGDNNIQAGRDVHVHEKPPVEKPVIERRPDGLSPAQAREVQSLIEGLVEETSDMSRDDAFEMWWSRFYNRYKVNKYENLTPNKLPDVRKWQKQQVGILRNSPKTRDRDSRRHNLYGVCKSAMRTMGVTEDEYYPQVAARLKMRKPFTSLTKLTMHDLKRVVDLMRRDSKPKRS